MSWFDSTFLYRTPLSIRNTGGGHTVDLQFDIPVDYGLYWDNSLSNFNDIRITAADGVTLLPFQMSSSSNHGNKLATVIVNNYSWEASSWGGQGDATTANAVVKAYMYFGNDTSNLASGQSNAFNVQDHISNAISPQIDVARPLARRGATFVVAGQGTGQTKAPHTLAKHSSEITKVYWDLSEVLQYRKHRYEKTHVLEEIAWVQCSMYDSNGVVNTMLDPATVKFSSPHIFSHIVKAGSNETNYILICKVGTDDGQGGTRILDVRANIKVQDYAISTT